TRVVAGLCRCSHRPVESTASHSRGSMRRAMALLAVALAAAASPACDGESPVEQKVDPRLTLSADSVALEVGASATMTAVVLDSSEPALFASRDETVATVNAGGAINGVGVGTTYVVAT